MEGGGQMLIIHLKSLSSVSCIECHKGENTQPLNYFSSLHVATTLWAQLCIIIQLWADSIFVRAFRLCTLCFNEPPTDYNLLYNGIICNFRRITYHYIHCSVKVRLTPPNTICCRTFKSIN